MSHSSPMTQRSADSLPFSMPHQVDRVDRVGAIEEWQQVWVRLPLISGWFAEVPGVVRNEGEPGTSRSIGGNLIRVKLYQDGIARTVLRTVIRCSVRDGASGNPCLHRIRGRHRRYRRE